MNSNDNNDSNDSGSGVDWDVVFAYTRKDAIRDGVLVAVDPSECKLAQFTCQDVAITSALAAAIRDIPDTQKARGVTERSRRLGLIRAGSLGVMVAAIEGRPFGPIEIPANLDTSEGRINDAKLVPGANDDGKLCVTIMLTHED